VTVVHHDTFVRGKHVEVKVRENLFLKQKISIADRTQARKRL
jgi:hypothetical protein